MIKIKKQDNELMFSFVRRLINAQSAFVDVDTLAKYASEIYPDKKSVRSEVLTSGRSCIAEGFAVGQIENNVRYFKGKAIAELSPAELERRKTNFASTFSRQNYKIPSAVKLAKITTS